MSDNPTPLGYSLGRVSVNCPAPGAEGHRLCSSPGGTRMTNFVVGGQAARGGSLDQEVECVQALLNLAGAARA